jgi:hypothetical protein
MRVVGWSWKIFDSMHVNASRICVIIAFCRFGCVLITIGLGGFHLSSITLFDNESFIMKINDTQKWRMNTFQSVTDDDKIEAFLFVTNTLSLRFVFHSTNFFSVLELSKVCLRLSGYHLRVQKFLRFLLQYAYHIWF